LDRTISLLNATLESTQDGILVVDQAGKITNFNHRFAEMWRIPDSIQAIREGEQMRAFVLDQLSKPEDFNREVRELYGKPEAESFDVLDFKDRRTFERNSQPQHLNDRIVGRVWSFRNVSARKQAEEALVKLKKAVDSSDEVVFITDPDGLITFVNPEFTRLYGYSAAETIGKTTPRILKSGQMKKEDYAGFWQSLLGQQSVKGELINKAKDGHYITIDGSANSIIDEKGNTIGFVAIQHDITSQKRAEKVQEMIYAISQTAISSDNIYEFYHSIHSSLAELIHVENFYIALYDPSSDLISFPYFVDQCDEPQADTKPRRGVTEYVLRNGQKLLAPRQICDQLIQKGEIDQVGAPSIDWMGVPLKVDGQVIGVMATQSYQEDIHFNQEDLHLFEFVSTQVAQMIDRKRVEQKIQYSGIHDAMTGLYNRAYFDEEMKRLERGRQFPVSVLIADLDDLKETNDGEGHAAGDELLRQAAKALRSAFRGDDVVARIGGDEFAVLLPGIDAKAAKIAMQRINDNIELKNASRKGRALQISMGASTAEKGGSLVEALKQADDQMYVEKQSKR
jgi:diguanylate cyclase (GGDEF)-like protein/PAS domain S-box-containing protein